MKITSSYRELSLDIVDPNPNQPRQDFNEATVQKLAISLQENTLLQAVTVRSHPTIRGRYMIIAGERRFRAMRVAGIEKTTFKVYEGPDVAKSYILSAIENIQRENLNPIEEAICYQRLHDEEHLTWEQVGELLGKDISVILLKIKLLTFPQEIQERVRTGDLPQVTALNLAQWRNEEGDYLRMAHDLIAGRDSAEVHFRKETVRGQRLVQAKLPKTTDEYARRIVKLAGKVQSMPAVLEAFLRLDSKEQSQVLEAIHPSVFGKLRVRFVALYRATQAISERMNTYDAHRTRRGPALDEVPASVPETVTLQSPPMTPIPAPVPKPILDIPTPVPKSGAPPPPPPPNTPPSSKGENGNRGSNGGVQSWDLSTRILGALFYSGGRRNVNFSRNELVEVVHEFLPPGANIEVVVLRALDSARSLWRTPPRGDEKERHFIRLVAQFRRDFGDPKRFEDALKWAAKEDRSGDPVLFL